MNSKSELAVSLWNIYHECIENNWDCYGAEPVSYDVYKQVIKVLAAIPEELVKSIDLGPEPDGCIAIEWYRDPENQLSISIGKDAVIPYAGIVRTHGMSGTCIMGSELPPQILNIVRQIYEND